MNISLIIPTYFEENLLEQLLKEFTNELKQKYNFELIVSDGGSTDATISIAKKYVDKLVVKTKEERQTIAEGRNDGAKAAEGEVLVFLNADCMPKNIIDFFNFIEDWRVNGKKYGAVACKVTAFENEVLLRDKFFYLLHNNYVRFLNFIGVGMGRGECQIIRRNVFDEVNGYNSKLVGGEDFDLYRRITKHHHKILYSTKIVIKESPRRFRKYGYLKTLWYWTLNSLYVIFKNKSVSKEWEAIR